MIQINASQGLGLLVLTWVQKREAYSEKTFSLKQSDIAFSWSHILSNITLLSIHLLYFFLAFLCFNFYSFFLSFAFPLLCWSCPLLLWFIVSSRFPGLWLYGFNLQFENTPFPVVDIFAKPYSLTALDDDLILYLTGVVFKDTFFRVTPDHKTFYSIITQFTLLSYVMCHLRA